MKIVCSYFCKIYDKQITFSLIFFLKQKLCYSILPKIWVRPCGYVNLTVNERLYAFVREKQNLSIFK